MPHIVIEARYIRPIPFDGDETKSLSAYQLLRDTFAHAIKLGGAVGRFSKQHDLRVADPLQQRVELRGSRSNRRTRMNR